jgi:FtsP/CotA-like multicopper oxidase with cupredoxin domain
MLGRMGNVVLINGQKHPAMQAAAGSRERWRFVNSANGRYFNLELPGHALRVIGWDGGLVETPYETTTLLIAPGERYDVLVELTGSEGDALELRTLHYDRGHNIPDPGPIEVLAIELGPSVAPAAALPASFGVIDAIPFDDNTPRRRFVLEEDDTDPSKPVFTINSEAFPNITPVRGPTGLVEIWEIDNQAEMDHPFHLHGMSLQQVGAQTGWKDTINVKQKSVVQLAVRYGDPGRWMYHCHILEHAERGMMGELEVGP